MNEDPDVTAWFADLDHPLEDAMLAARRVILEADERVTETMKWKSPTFMYEGNIVSIDPKAKRHVSLLFHKGAEIPGDHPLLEGGGAVARYIRFTDEAAVDEGAEALAAIIRAWCESRA